MEWIVYAITNRVNGKVYVGITRKSLEERWKQHLRNCTRYNNHKRRGSRMQTCAALYEAINASEGENFVIMQIDTCANCRLNQLTSFF